MPSVKRGAAYAVTATLAVAPLAVATPALAAPPAPEAALVINEVNSDGTDWIELKNLSAEPIDASGVIVSDADADHAYALPEGTDIAAGGYLVLGADDFGFGLGKGDSVRLFAAGTEVVEGVISATATPFDSTTWAAGEHTNAFGASWGRLPDGTGEFTSTQDATPGASNSPAEVPVPTVESSVVINEVQSSAPDTEMGGEDWIELASTADAALDLTGVVVSDADADHAYVLPEGTEIAAGGYLVLTGDVFGFGLGKGDSVRLFSTGTAIVAGEIDVAATPFEATTWPEGQHTVPSWGRCADGTGDFRMTGAATPGAANDCSGDVEVPVEEPAEFSGDLTINEVESNGDDTDWVEVMNLTDVDIDISGWAIKDDDDSRTDVVPAGSVVPAGGLLVIDQESATYPEGFTFGLGNGDMFRLYDGARELAAKYTWPGHALVSWARCPDGTGEWADATASTKGEPNECSTPLRLNEVNSSGADFAEIINIGATDVDASGLIVKDAEDDHVYEIPAGTVVAPGAVLLLTDLGYGLGGADAVRLFEADGETLIDSYEWAEHGAPSWGRCPDGRGEWATTASATPGELNDCEGFVRAEVWPGSADVMVLDDESWFSGDLSGIDYDAATDTLWAVQNGDGLLYELTADATGTWSLAPGYEAGRVLGYPAGEAGVVDAEGVTVREGEPGVVYVSSERNNDASGVSRPSVLRYEVSDTGALVATDEWNLSSIPALSALPANGGLEGITWIPSLDAFAVGVEGTASVYVVQLGADGSVSLLDTLSTDAAGFSLVADVQWDAERGQLWVVCDEACDGRIATFALADGSWEMTALYERPAGMANIANEGFAIAPSSTAVDGAVATFYVDDADTDGFSLRSGTLPAVKAADPVDPVDPVDPGDPVDPVDPGEPAVPGDGSSDGAGQDGGEGGQGGQAPSGDDLTETESPNNLGCTVDAPGSAERGGAITIVIDRACAGADVTSVEVWMYSEPTFVGTFSVAADGSVDIEIPTSLPAGQHTIEVRLTDGTIVGSTTIQVATDGTASLSSTGPADPAALTWGALTLALAGAVVLAVRRRVS
ncbi:lamin tail domain-containing protein [Demequina sp. NBRC 110055]|uniref:lamin tail domain-containing protein n=1 Tax=Demequina sp. NBRC 110055 TaxID=1570344 RepID=UPI000A067A05|nr:lamin tail domain-containing protein [Demequina sp. NBRC 110055]